MFKEKIEKKIKKVVRDIFAIDLERINLETPPNEKMGDYAWSCFELAKKLKKNPTEIATQVCNKIETDEIIAEVREVGPYVNFKLSAKYFAEALVDILKQDINWGKIKKLEKKKFLLEHSSPNLFKPFHIGHLVNNSIGESLGRILSFVDGKVEHISFPSDVSPGIAKTIWAIKFQKLATDKLTLKDIADAYVLGTKKYEKDDAIKKEVENINKNIYQKIPGEDWDIYQQGRNLSLQHFQEITKKLGSEFSDLIFESEAEEIGKKIVLNNVGKIFTKSKGAIIFEGSKYGLFDNVFINSAGFGTYLTKDLGLLKIKFNKFNFAQSITITDVEQKQHFQLVKKSAELLHKEWSDKSLYLQHGRMSFAGKIKLSSRYGNVPLVSEVLDKLKEKILKKSKDGLKESEIEKIAIASLKYSILRASAGRNIVFDIEKSLDFTGDTGPYLQYTYVRARSILRKQTAENKQKFTSKNIINAKTIPTVGKIILEFPKVVEKSWHDYSAHHIAGFLHKLSAEFNSFYAQTKILDKTNPNYEYNLALTQAVALTLKNGLYLLGIKTVKKM